MPGAGGRGGGGSAAQRPAQPLRGLVAGGSRGGWAGREHARLAHPHGQPHPHLARPGILGLGDGRGPGGRRRTASTAPWDGSASWSWRLVTKGHADNAAAALYGGFCVATIADGQPLAVRLEPPAGLLAALYVPDRHLSTSAMRAALPDSVPFGDAVHNVGAAALAVAAISAGPPGPAVRRHRGPPPRALPCRGLPGAAGAAGGRSRCWRAGRLPVWRRLDGHRLQPAIPRRRPRSRRPWSVVHWPSG